MTDKQINRFTDFTFKFLDDTKMDSIIMVKL